MKVIITPKVYEYLENLVIILFENDYFGHEDSARKYVDDLYYDIKTNLSILVKKRAPKYFDKYGKGMYYVNFRKNKHTQWYVFFRIYQERGEIIYQVRYIGNNHTVAQYL
ncbi:MAG: hypothetical protein FWD60_11360 [Candidatus Azobacteroides sp.]|nr:hypothetical protein [Candidatus Azobacteroides sp.]